MAEGETTTSTGVVVRGSVFGGGNAAGVGGNTVVNIEATNCTVQTGVYGGCNTKGVVAGNSTVTITGGKIGDGSTDTETGVVTVTTSANVHGGGYGSETLVQGDVTVNIGKKEGSTLSGSAKLYGDVYGGSAQGLVNATERATAGVYTVTMYDPDPTDEDATSAKCATKVRLYGGTIYGDLYGGGLGLDADGTENDKAADVYGPVTVDVEGGSVSNVYGCNNALGTPKENVIVNITGGTVTEDVYGGGNLAASERSITVNIKGGTVNRDVYGGGALANTNIGNVSSGYGTTTETISSTATNTTIVNLTSGTVGRDVYGGGLGRKQATGVTAVEAKVYGDVTVKLNETVATDNCKVVRNIFGCNNANGSPQGLVSVLIYKTVDPITTAVPEGQIRYHVKGVFGGGNEAAYNPYNIRTSSNLTGNKAQVTISGCSVYIEKVYGGGNAAPVPEANVAISGAAAIDYVYGGGCGVVDGAVANVGWLNDDDETEYGTGEATTIITAGKINHVFAGSDSHGDIREKAKLNISEDETSSCKTDIAEVYSYGNQATMSCESEVTVGCTTKPIGALYGGAMNADVDHDIVLNINGGNFTRVFGGNNAGGSINGSIKVNIEETSTSCGINIDELYGCGNEAPYSIWGTEKDTEADKWVVKTTGTTGTDKNDPQVNIYSFTSIGSVFGGGKGSSAVVFGESAVNINIVKANTGYTLNNIYGGGNEAEVQGKTHINIGTLSQVNLPSADDETTMTPVKGAKITNCVYGGGNEANVTGDTEVNIGTVSFTGEGIDGVLVVEDVYGGGKGSTTNVTGTAIVNIGAEPTTGTYVGNSTVTGNVYGGSAFGKVNNAVVELFKNTSVSKIFGGGKGYTDASTPANNKTAQVTTSAAVTMHDGTVQELYGGCNERGVIDGTVQIDLKGGTVGTAYTSGPISDVVFGGGLGENTYVKQGVTVNIGTSGVSSGATINGNVYGGGAKGHVNAEEVENATTQVKAPASTTTTAGKLYATTVNLYSGTIYGDAYGGGLGKTESGVNKPAFVGGDVILNLNGAALNVASGTYTVGTETKNYQTGRIFGCNNALGSPQGHVQVHVFKTNKSTDTSDSYNYDLATVYGGGNEADYEPGTITDAPNAEVIIEGCTNTKIENVYGGGNAAAVPGTEVWILGANIIDNVFGGGNGELGPAYAAHVGFHRTSETTKSNYGIGDGQTYVKLVGGTINTVYGGSNSNGDIRGGSNITMPTLATYSESHSGATADCCTNLVATNIYGGGRNADMSSGTSIVLGCMPYDQIDDIYAGARSADVAGDVSLTITSGRFGRVFGGNKDSGALKGAITVNIEETTDNNCGTPIVIGELYGGGNLADYSVYGYKEIRDPDDDTKTIIVARSSLNDNEGAISIIGEPAADKKYSSTQWYANPKLNVRAFTSIGKIFGGGYQALMAANPTVDINVVKGSHADDTNMHTAANNYTYPGGTMDVVISATETLHLDYPAHKKGEIGAIGNVFGGGNLAKIIGSATVNIGTEPTIGFITEPIHLRTNPSTPLEKTDGLYVVAVEGANITGNVYGGGNLADVTGNTQVNICAKEVTSGTTTSWQSVAYGTGLTGVTIGSAGVNDKDHGHVFGGGKGVADNFTCDKAMVGTEDAGMVAGYLYGNTGVTIGNGTIYGNVYGGGEVGRVEMNTTVKIGIDDGSAPVIEGSVYGAGQGVDTHGYSGLARGNSRVTIDGEAWVKGSVYGGGEKASVGRYWVNGAPDPNHEAPTVPSGLPEGMPYALKDLNSGKCYVTIQGHAKIGPTTLTMPTFLGNVFGGCKGILPGAYSYADNTTKPKRWVGTDWSYFANEADYIQFIRTLAMNNETHVTIDENAFVKGSVYGGSENGGVLDNTYVTIAGGQIGCGEGYDAPYTDWSAASLPECPHWTYGIDTNNDNKKDLFAPYDKFAKEDGTYDYTDIALPSTEQQVSSSEGGRPASKASDGHTFYGNVFGGGSGKDPYKPGKWLMTAGGVGGKTNVTITGGHILTSVYGGNELTNVGEELVNDETKNKGKCIIRMSGGSIGVPRTLQQILDHPVTCNLFGAGKGDQRVLFNKWTNVNDVDIQITGGTIYGSVFGGGEDGHVMRDVKLEIGQASGKTTMIGTLGTSGFEGNVFGGGRGFGGDAYTAGNVAGSVDLDITGGTMLGSVYGGGRLASVGYGLYDATTNGNPTPGYGEIREDNKNDNGDVVTYFTTTSSMNKLGRGHINIDISGGTIGNTSEFVYPTAAQKADDGDLRNTSYDQTSNRLLHTKGGNVFAGGMGRRTLLSGDPITADIIDWHKLGNAKSTKLTIRQASENVATIIRGNVYGGGELGTVLGNHQLYNGTTAVVDANNIPVMAGTEIVISGGTIGTQVAAKTGDGGGDAYYFGSVYGGGMGEIYEEGTGSSATTVLAGGNVNDSTKVSMSNGSVRGSVYGGGELGQVFGSADVAVSGGSIGVSGFGGAEYGNIYGGGKGSTEKLDAGLIKTNTWVTVSGSPQIWHNIYGGGAYGSVGTITRGSDATYIHVPGQTSVPDMPKSWAENTGSALVRILSGTIGRNGNENGMVFGSSRGDVGAPGEIHDKLAWVKKAKVVIGATGTTGPNIKGSVYGSGENGHLFQDAVVEIHSGVVGIAEGEPIGSYTAGGASYPYRGNVYGGGCGTDKYYSNPTGVANPHDGKGDKYNPLAGIVLGDASVTMDGGTVVHNIYGAGAMGSVGTMTTDTDNHLVISSGGKTTIDISGGTVGVDGIVRDDGNSNGNVFGAARGDVDTDQTDVALVKTTEVTISQAEGKTTYVWGNVYGGGETGDVGTYYTITEEGANKGTNAYLEGSGACVVEVTGGTVHHNVFGAGKGESSKYECKKAMVSSTDVTIDTNAKVNGNVYGGGEVGRVEYNTVVKIGSGAGAETGGTSKPEIGGSVYGAGAGLETHGYSALVRGNSTVTVEGNAKVNGNVYGGGEKATVGKYWVSLVAQDPNEAPPSGFPDGMPYKTRDGGICTVNIQGYAQVGPDAGGSENAGHVFGAGKGVEPSYSAGESKRMKNGDTWEAFSGVTGEADYLQFLETLALASVTNVTIDGNAKVKGSVYGGSESGFVQDEAYVTIKNGKIGSTTYGDIYGGGRGLSNFAEAGRVKGGTTIAVDGGTMNGSVYGGGELGIVTGAVLVNINNGIVEKDVYGGGALANTNTNNWNGTTLTETYLEVGGLIAGTSSVVGYYTKSGDNYTILTTGTAVAGTKYYRKVNTTVNLLGGTIKGDAYGGGLGQKKDFNGATTDIAAVVYGDISVTLDGTAFEINKYTDAGYTNVVKSGRVFGCNNLYGSPQGNVTVTVNKTVAGNVSRTPASIKVDGYGKVLLDDTEHYKSTYEVAAVYGGGNLAPYKATGKKTYVIINGCGKTSIETVYGGGNAAAVPEAKVDINGTYEIGAVFGGGNGKDKYKSDAGWVPNPGANIGKTVDGEVIGNGNTTTWIYGGTVHEAYGASNEKGTITGNVLIDVGTVAETDLNYCKLDVGKVVGAGKNADVNGDIITILGCKPDEEIPIYYGGADNANVNGNVELTITSGNFGQVFGGNNVGGIINGHIILNIEEITPCSTPINIKKLYLGGNQAAYSVYGYYVVTQNASGTEGDGSMSEGYSPVLTNDKLTFRVRTSADDPHKPVKTFNGDTKTWEVYTGTYDSTNKKWMWEVSPGVTNDVVYDQPRMNVISCTSIDELFGGGYGVGGDMYADPTVNINMIQGSKASGVPAKMTAKGLTPSDNPNNLGIIGTVYGGGDAADVVGNTTINIGTEPTVDVFKLKVDSNNDPILGEGGAYTWDTATEKKTVLGAYIAGNVYGGGKLADVTGNTYVNVCAKEADNASTTDVIEYKGVTISGTGYEGVTISGNVFGGGKGIADSFTCAKAMIGVDKENDGKTDITKESTNKGTRVSIGNGTVNGSVYGGGEIGRVEWNTVVTIGLPVESGTSAPVIRGDVFGAGKGVEPYGYAALVRGNTFVTVQADAKVGENVFGGGEIASVGKYTIASAEYAASHPEIEEGMPYSLANQGSGYCNVIVRGNAEIGPDGMVMNNTTTGKPDDSGHVFGAGKGVLPYENLATTECQTHAGQHHPGRMAPGNVWECYDGNEAKYLSFVETQALATQTDVTIDDNAFVKGSVYGGSENGHVQHDTHVTIEGECQIGAGYDTSTKKSLPKYTGWPTKTEDNITTSWAECAHWEYDASSAAPYDLYAKYKKTVDGKDKYYYDEACTYYAEGGSNIGKDGHTYYGNVFGGGSGVIPYAPGKWHRAAGSVGGNTQVDITGGHILTSVYGGNEQTDVGTYTKDDNGALVVPVRGGKCTINMTGGTLGVPRTAADAKLHPVTCYLFGAGKGDQRIFFNTWTNVIETEVNIGGNARIYGSTFGGGEDGHVIKEAVTNISGSAVIGTTGTSYVDGNVFGGGRGFSGDAQTAGTVGGNIEVNISGGTMLGNVYGGGRLASVGTQFTSPTDPNYGNFIEDEKGSDAKTYGHVTVNISGGTIGNNGTDRNVIGDVSGNVFGGSMGRLTLLNGETNPIWPKMAQVKATKVIVSGGTIKHNVYGGGELGTVRDDAVVTISGGQVNRDVYGAGYGSDQLTPRTTIEVKEPKPGVTNPTSAADYNVNYYTFTPMLWAGCVGKSTTVNINGGLVRKSVYGGGEMASVGIIDSSSDKDGNLTHSVTHTDEKDGFALSWPYEFKYTLGYEGATHVNVTGGRIGVTKNDDDINTDNGDVYGGGKGIAGDYKDYVYCANVGSSEVTINYTSSAATEDPTKYLDGGDCITGAVYGGAENGHVMGDTKLTLVKGLVGHSIYGGGSGKGQFTKTLDKITGVEVVTNNTPTPAATQPTQTANQYDATIYSVTAGKVFGNSTVEMSGGYVVRNVYGGGNLGSVGKGNYAGGADDYSTAGYGEKLTGNLWDGVSDESKAFLNSGKSTVTITGGTVGYIDFTKVSDYTYSGLPYGNVFGGCRGESAPNIGESPRYLYCPTFFSGYANETEVTIGNAGGTGPTIWGSVYGGGMDGHVRRDAKVTINGGEIGRPYTGDGSAADLAKVEWSQCGNVYGAGSGIGQYKYDFNYDGDYEDVVKYTNPLNNRTTEVKERDFSTSAGSVTRFTTVIVNGGKIHRNVYGGGSLSSIGGPKIPPITYDPYRKGDTTTGHGAGKQSQNEVTIAGGTIGDEAGFTKGYGGCVFGASRGDETLANPTSFASSVWTDVNIQGGTIVGEVYGGGEAGTVRQSTDVQLTGGMIVRDAFAGGKGTSKVAADVGGDATIELNKQVADDAANAAKMGAVVKGNVFGANNVNGTPKGHVLVHVYGTQNENTTAINAKVDGKYDVTGVYGGGKSSDYVPDANDTKQSTEVIIEGCDLTSIYEVYGGGYGAATPATDVLIKGTKIIENVFGGGYGASTAGFTNPGANIGYHTDKSKYDLGTGKALVRLMAGTIKNVYGASNTLGDIRGGSNVTNVANDGSAGCCDKLTVGEIYGGGKSADMYGGAEIVLGCMPNDWIGAIYAGAEDADIGGDVGLTLTSGKFERVFGGNNKGGKIDGYIEVNIEENPECDTPIIIGELYGGGNEAKYEVPQSYVDKWKDLYGRDANYPSPRVNVRAFTSIGNIYGGGLGEGALVTGNPLVNINELLVDETKLSATGKALRNYGGEDRSLKDNKGQTVNVKLYPHETGKMGVIGNVFGGGNAAPVKGNTYVSIGTEAYERLANIVVGETDVDNYYTRSGSKPYVYTKASGKAAANTVYYMPVQGADIRGNVYGGGNNAAVTGDPKVVIGQRKE